MPREIFVAGELDAHDSGQLKDRRIVFVNTLYNCLATPSKRHSFTPTVHLQDRQVRPMSLSFASNEILGLITHDPLSDG